MRNKGIPFGIILAAAMAVFGLSAGRGFAQGEAVTLEITAEHTGGGFAFDRDTLTVPAGARVVIEFDNRDRVPHNVSVYENREAKKVLFYGAIINGLETIRYEFTAPERPGTYFFRCDLHPRGMVGDFVVE